MCGGDARCAVPHSTRPSSLCWNNRSVSLAVPLQVLAEELVGPLLEDAVAAGLVTPATVTVDAGYSKRRRKDVLPMRPDTAQAVKAHLACKLPDAPAFAMPATDHNSRVMRADLQAAREQACGEQTG